MVAAVVVLMAMLSPQPTSARRERYNTHTARIIPARVVQIYPHQDSMEAIFQPPVSLLHNSRTRQQVPVNQQSRIFAAVPPQPRSVQQQQNPRLNTQFPPTFVNRQFRPPQTTPQVHSTHVNPNPQAAQLNPHSTSIPANPTLSRSSSANSQYPPTLVRPQRRLPLINQQSHSTAVNSKPGPSQMNSQTFSSQVSPQFPFAQMNQQSRRLNSQFRSIQANPHYRSTQTPVNSQTHSGTTSIQSTPFPSKVSPQSRPLSVSSRSYTPQPTEVLVQGRSVSVPSSFNQTRSHYIMSPSIQRTTGSKVMSHNPSSANIPTLSKNHQPSLGMNVPAVSRNPQYSQDTNIPVVTRIPQRPSSNPLHSQATNIPTSYRNLQHSQAMNNQAGGTRNPQHSQGTNIPTRMRNIQNSQGMNIPVASRSSQHFQATNNQANIRNLRNSQATSIPAGSRNTHNSQVTSIPVGSRNVHNSQVTSIPADSRNLQKAQVTSIPAGSRNTHNSRVTSIPEFLQHSQGNNIPMDSRNVPHSQSTNILMAFKNVASGLPSKEPRRVTNPVTNRIFKTNTPAESKTVRTGLSTHTGVNSAFLMNSSGSSSKSFQSVVQDTTTDKPGGNSSVKYTGLNAQTPLANSGNGTHEITTNLSITEASRVSNISSGYETPAVLTTIPMSGPDGNGKVFESKNIETQSTPGGPETAQQKSGVSSFPFASGIPSGTTKPSNEINGLPVRSSVVPQPDFNFPEGENSGFSIRPSRYLTVPRVSSIIGFPTNDPEPLIRTPEFRTNPPVNAQGSTQASGIPINAPRFPIITQEITTVPQTTASNISGYPKTSDTSSSSPGNPPVFQNISPKLTNTPELPNSAFHHKSNIPELPSRINTSLSNNTHENPNNDPDFPNIAPGFPDNNQDIQNITSGFNESVSPRNTDNSQGSPEINSRFLDNVIKLPNSTPEFTNSPSGVTSQSSTPQPNIPNNFQVAGSSSNSQVIPVELQTTVDSSQNVGIVNSDQNDDRLLEKFIRIFKRENSGQESEEGLLQFLFSLFTNEAEAVGGGEGQGGERNILSKIGLGSDTSNHYTQIISSAVENFAHNTSKTLKFVRDELAFQGEKKLQKLLNGIEKTGKTVAKIGQNSYRGYTQNEFIVNKFVMSTTENLGTFADSAVSASYNGVSRALQAFFIFMGDLKTSILDALIMKGEAARKFVEDQTRSNGEAFTGILDTTAAVAEDNIMAITGLEHRY
ncbi:hypothetical protein Pcinc_009514 [Petrolisthes cinctipes]|uniref:Uncharacterized protein n=1 Tax=Petrolisthes cinctipes TaxID=88211 RepID=A0AAE1GB47_PETCI|nr:hypothetical protein Pcinc_009514 [Petrolisthes cinctipes]